MWPNKNNHSNFGVDKKNIINKNFIFTKLSLIKKNYQKQ